MTTEDALSFYYYRAFKTIFLCSTACKVVLATIVTLYMISLVDLEQKPHLIGYTTNGHHFFRKN